MRARFGIASRLQYYTTELCFDVERSASIFLFLWKLHQKCGTCHGTPRIANALLRRVRDFAQIKGNGTIDMKSHDTP
jgi:Holliday junction DNA helicase RuvB